ncbi:DUF1850 domain-containing protein [Brachyspira aalborgi]|uniref:DUF1850 domain-containing protein n=1 Tax=Brachyspira aalborgi TaxID=29522 RepID=A0A5C8CJC3_9SPIR|nr:DUF1850 domain-containing protein [Brachyspira aalborgi]TXJ12441.1 DUF1850 domain-containing protein [Brachyspira aalborgi]TXJ14153.1 DUF1850 domain-containing protein [Brachyspira aalborgi]TXJ18850.1 DUF1850 domain-containing protein [Brachyspira aalborgi]TXJ46942.1 DUF1850 domain-containing protein [Brachyspira aalborgi]TXJ52493.1 DUF1850 domain-containing protein [Brachyspira aalborgi]
MKKIIVLLALIIILFIPIFPKLLINNKIFNIEKKEFIISYTHSVNRGRVRDYYIIKSKYIILSKTRFMSYGAGIPEPEKRQKFTETEDYIEISDINRKIDNLYLFVGTIANHKIEIDEKKIELKEIFKPQENIKIEYKILSIFEYIKLLILNKLEDK